MKWLLAIVAMSGVALAAENKNVEVSSEHFVRYQYQDKISYGKLDNDAVLPVSGDLFGEYSVAKNSIPLESVEVLLPTKPEKVFAVGMNFASHLASPADAPPPMFLKLPSSLILTGEVIQVPPKARNVHFEGELVVVIGRELSQASEEEAEQRSLASRWATILLKEVGKAPIYNGSERKLPMVLARLATQLCAALITTMLS